MKFLALNQLVKLFKLLFSLTALIDQWKTAQPTTLWLQVRTLLNLQLFNFFWGFFLLDQRTPGSNPHKSKYTNFKVQKHHDSQELTIPDFCHLRIILWKKFWYMPIPRPTLPSKCHFSIAKRSISRVIISIWPIFHLN